MEFKKVVDSRNREDFSDGAKRDTRVGKGRFDLIPAKPLVRLAKHYENGAVKYGDNNWTKGIPSSRYFDSMVRHAYKYMDGDRSEDHLSAIVFNCFGICYNEENDNKFHDLKPLDTKQGMR